MRCGGVAEMGERSAPWWRGGPGLRSRLPRSSVPTQFVWYLVVGGLSFLTDMAGFTLLLMQGAPVMVALVFGFLIGTLANYLLSLTLAFTGGRHRRVGEIARLVAVALIGLALTAGLVWAFMEIGGLGAITAKVIATVIALVWNYTARRLFVFHKEMPARTWKLSGQAVLLARKAARQGHE